MRHEDEIAMIREHIRRGEVHVSRQREIVAKLRSRGHPADLAESLLWQFEETLAQHKITLDIVESEQKENDDCFANSRAR